VSPVEVISALDPGVEVISAVGPDVVATTTVLPPQAIANVVLSGPPGPIGPAGTLAGYHTPQQFGAVGDGVADDTAAVQAAITAAGTTGAVGKGGVVYFPPGTYNCAAALYYYPNTMWTGAGVSASVLKLTQELWPGGSALAAHFVLPAPGATFGANIWRCSNMLMQGPGVPVVGSANTPCKTTGIRITNGMFLDNLNLQNFFAGYDITGDHNKFYGVYSHSNYYGLEYPDDENTFGNNGFYSCNFAGNMLAGIHLGGHGSSQADFFSECHNGFSPVAIFKTDYQNGWDGSGNPVYTGGTPSNTPMFLGTHWNVMPCEQVGNGVVIDISTGAGQGSITGGTRLRGLTNGWNTATYGTTKSPLNAADSQGLWVMYLRGPTSGIGEVDAVLVANPSGAGIVRFRTADSTRISPSFTFTTAVPANFFGSGTTFSQYLTGSGLYALKNATGVPNNALASNYGDGVVMVAQAVINAGDCVEVTGTGSVQRATGTKPVFGIAVTPAPQALMPIVIQVNGFTAVNTTQASVAGASVLYLDATTTYMVNATNTGGKVVGVSSIAGAASTVGIQLMQKAA
jgi:hypothetical protein